MATKRKSSSQTRSPRSLKPRSSGGRPSIAAAERKILGRKVKQLRRQGKLPANIFGRKVKSTAVTVDRIEFEKVFRQTGETTLIDLKLTSRKSPLPVLVSNVQHDPVSNRPLHIDFHQVDLSEKVTASVPIKIKGESPAVKDKGAVLVTVLSEVEVEALPTDLPDQFDVDLAKLTEFGDSILVKDLRILPGVEIKVGESEVIVAVQEPKVEEEPEPAPEAPPEGEEPEKPAEAEEKEAKPPEEKEAKPPEEKKKEKTPEAVVPKESKKQGK